jgi:hypothetical protein
MPRLSPERYPGTPIAIDHEPFEEATVNGVLAAVGDAFPLLMKRERFRERLNGVAQLYSFVLGSNTEPTGTAEQKYLLDLRWAVRRLAALVPLEAIPGGDDDRFAPEPPHGVLRLLEAPMADLIARRLSDERGAWVERQQGSGASATARRSIPPALSASDIYGGNTPKDILTFASEVANLIEEATTHALNHEQNERHSLGRPAVYGQLALPLMDLYKEAFGQEPGISRSDDNTEATGPMVRFIKTVCATIGLVVSGDAIAKEKAKHYPKKGG